jgi:hypothetical protein
MSSSTAFPILAGAKPGDGIAQDFVRHNAAARPPESRRKQGWKLKKHG